MFHRKVTVIFLLILKYVDKLDHFEHNRNMSNHFLSRVVISKMMKKKMNTKFCIAHQKLIHLLIYFSGLFISYFSKKKIKRNLLDNRSCQSEKADKVEHLQHMELVIF